MGSSSQVKAQKLANEANIQIADKNNDTSIDLMREQNEWNLQQWERENQYNTPAEQVKRLEAAGLNPLLIEGYDSGNAVSPAQGAAVPTLQQAHVQPEFGDPQIKANAFQQIGAAFKNFGEFAKSMQDSGISNIQLGFMRDMALKGYNPETIRAKTSLELYNQLVTSGKYQIPQIEAIIRGYNVHSNYEAAVTEERKQFCENLRQEYEGIKFTNKFNKDKAPLEIARLYAEVRDIYLGTNIKSSVAESQINAADASARLSDSQAGLAGAQTNLINEQVETQKETTEAVRYENAVKRFRAGLADIGINPDDKHLPFFLGLGMKLNSNELDAVKVSNLFENIGYAERVGWKNLYKSGANLTRFQLEGEPQGPLGVSGMMQQFSRDMRSFFDRNDKTLP